MHAVGSGVEVVHAVTSENALQPTAWDLMGQGHSYMHCRACLGSPCSTSAVNGRGHKGSENMAIGVGPEGVRALVRSCAAEHADLVDMVRS